MINLNWQRDDRWHGEVMTSADPKTDPQKRQWVDHLGDYGCLETSLSNIIMMTERPTMTPKAMNDLIVAAKGYNYLADNTVDGSIASFLSWDVFKTLFPMFDYDFHTKIYQEDSNNFYIAHVTLYGGNHYINCIKQLSADKYLCFDVWDCRLKIYDRNEIIDWHCLRRKV